MKTVGLIGGMSWESTSEYYKKINEGIKEHLGGLHSGKILMYSFDFEEIEVLQHKNQWDELTEMLVDAGVRLKKAGADFLAICTNTMHKVADEVAQRTGLPVLHIADVTAEAIIQKNKNVVGLLGTDFTMSEDFYKKRLNDKYNIEVMIPDEKERERVHKVIYDELCCGIVKMQSKSDFITIINNLKEKGAEGVILGCTEIPMLIEQKDLDIRVFDSMKLHAEAIVKEMLKD
ncbi:aspartate/glutamate racemase family protein [Sebaldella sp. S0638]|uniref:aspartate/glutamate racemase family protein n=1 Tax=Sebaldella sp. S0638 TaxID=2957809 RepID=UPI00209D1DE3|nr:aspartate/glutamate racemase family protein [Sebaldella sp. S0638]MCP1226237.1 aspartate/glutamate racemase family protein [Sebaldella sp. S0638]